MSTAQSTLFPAPPLPTIQPASEAFTLRDYQREDCDEICRLWDEGTLHVLGVQATGLGKSVCIAELASRKPEGTRALIVVDSYDLTMDLFRTVKKHTGRKPGVLIGDFKEGEDSDILIATKQCLCAGDRYQTIDITEFDRLIIDECESALANKYIVMIADFLDRNPALKLVGLTATPLPASNRKITDLFQHAAEGPGLLYRDLQWGYLNGWLVKPLQGVLRCSLDFATLKIHKRKNGEEDYSDKDIKNLMLQQDEREWLELAGGIYKIARNHTTLVVCPNSTLIADKLAGYIEGHARDAGEQGIAYAIHRNLPRKQSWDLMRRFKKGEFPIATSVRMFEKGFDFDKVRMIVMVRRTRSLRLYTQIAGRGTRPLVEIRERLTQMPNRLARMRLISQSDKPSCVIVDCVGIRDDYKNILGVIDILGRGVREDIKERVRRMMLDKARAASDEADDEPGEDVGKQARAAAQEIREEWERQRERRAAVSADVDITYRIDNSHARPVVQTKVHRGSCSVGQAKLLIVLGVPGEQALGYSKKQAGAVIGSLKKQNVEPVWYRVKQWELQNGKIE